MRLMRTPAWMALSCAVALLGCSETTESAPATRAVTGRLDLTAMNEMVALRAFDTRGGAIDTRIRETGDFEIDLELGRAYVLVLIDATGHTGRQIVFHRNAAGALGWVLPMAAAADGDTERPVTMGIVRPAGDDSQPSEEPLAQVDSDGDGVADLDDNDDDGDDLADEADADADGDGLPDANAPGHPPAGAADGEHGDDQGNVGQRDDGDDDDGDHDDDDGDGDGDEQGAAAPGDQGASTPGDQADDEDDEDDADADDQADDGAANQADDEDEDEDEDD